MLGDFERGRDPEAFDLIGWRRGGLEEAPSYGC